MSARSFAGRYYLLHGIRELRGDEIPAATVVRFYSRLHRTPAGCLVWTGARNADGYGVVRISSSPRGGRVVLAHRLAYAIARGICPGDRVIGHLPALDHDRRCCEDLHLGAMTPMENTPAIYGLDADEIAAALAAVGLHDGEIPF